MVSTMKITANRESASSAEMNSLLSLEGLGLSGAQLGAFSNNHQ